MSDRLPKLCQHKHSGRFYITLNGSEVYLGTHKPKARRERDRVLGEWLAIGCHMPSSLGGPSDLKITELVDRYRVHCEGYDRRADGTPTSEVACIASAMKLLRRLYGEQPAAKFSPLAIQALRERFIDKDLCRGVVNQHVARIRRMFRWAVSQELLPPHVYKALAAVSGLRAGRTEARETEPIGPVTESVVEATLRHLPRTLFALECAPVNRAERRHLVRLKPD